jgi:hypothetical protein
MGIGDTHDIDRTAFEIHVSIFMVKDDNAVRPERASNFLRTIDVVMISEHSEPAMGSIQSRKNRSHDPGRHSAASEELHVDKVATEQDEVWTKRPSFGDDALKARDIVGMRAGMKI